MKRFSLLTTLPSVTLIMFGCARPDNVRTFKSPKAEVFLTVETYGGGPGPLGSDLTKVYAHFEHYGKSRRMSPKSGEAEIPENLAPGSDLRTVRRFMDSHHIVYTGYSKDLHRAYGKIYWSSINLYMKGYIFIELNFNEDGKLTSHEVVQLFQFLWE